jgi:excinuclease ABC subunit C
MTKDDLAKKYIPNESGVYFFLGPRKEILYIGKATNLKTRTKSYFAKDLADKRSPLITRMVLEAVSLDFTVTDSVLEALILETNLIRSHKPKYNVRSKDDKSFNYLVITNESIPRVLIVRGKDLTDRFTKKELKVTFGPYPSAASLRIALRIIRRLFRFYDTPVPIEKLSTKLDRRKFEFNRAIGVYPAESDSSEYGRTIRHLILFFRGKKKLLLRELEKDMYQHARSEEFEKANLCKKQIFALKHIEDIALIKNEKDSDTASQFRIEAYDISHHGGKHMVGVMVVILDNEPYPSEYRTFNIKNQGQVDDLKALQQVLSRRFTYSEWTSPDLIVVDGNQIHKQRSEAVLASFGKQTPVVAVTKGIDHKPKSITGQAKLIETHRSAILLANSEAHRFAINFHRKKQRATRF